MVIIGINRSMESYFVAHRFDIYHSSDADRDEPQEVGVVCRGGVATPIGFAVGLRYEPKLSVLRRMVRFGS